MRLTAPMLLAWQIFFSVLVGYSILGAAADQLALGFRPHLTLIHPYLWHRTIILCLFVAVCSLAARATPLRAFAAAHCRSFGASLIFEAVERTALIPEVFLGCVVLLIASDYTERRFIYCFSPGKFVLVAGCAALLLLVSVIRRINLEKAVPRSFSLPLLIAVQFVLAALFLKATGGRMLFNDDHPSFIYRLALLREHFPRVPFYNTDWNAGYIATEFLSTGSLGVYLISLPLTLLFPRLISLDGVSGYTLLIPYLFIFVIPLSLYAACRLIGSSRRAAAISALCGLAPTFTFFEYLLKFGTIGFLASVGIAPLLLAAVVRLALSERIPSYRDALLFVVLFMLCLSWPLSAVAFVPSALLGLFYLKNLLAPERRGKIALALLILAAVEAPFIIHILHARERSIGNFLSADTLPGSHSTILQIKKHGARTNAGAAAAQSKITQRAAVSFRNLQQELVKVNPLLLLFFIPGLGAIKDRRARLALLSTVILLFLLAACGDQFKPQLELRRMSIPAAFFMALAAGAAAANLLDRLLRNAAEASSWPRRLSSAAAAALLLGSIALSPLSAAAAYRNRTIENYDLVPPIVAGLSQAISQYGGDGRIFLLGFILHDLGSQPNTAHTGGHVAPLPVMTGKPLYASHYYHSRWSAVEPVPEQFRKRGSAGIEEFLDLMNATAVVTFRRRWTDYCSREPGYKLLFHEGKFHLWQRPAPAGGYFLKGSGTIKTEADQLLVKPDTEETVIKFRWFPSLRALPHAGVEMFPVTVFNEELGGSSTRSVQFIGLRAAAEVIQQGNGISIRLRE